MSLARGNPPGGERAHSVDGPEAEAVIPPTNGRAMQWLLIGLGISAVAMLATQNQLIARQLGILTAAVQQQEKSAQRAQDLELLMASLAQPEREALRYDLLKFMSAAVQDIAQRAQALEASRRLDEGRAAAERVRAWNVEGQKQVVLPPGKYRIERVPEPKQAP